MRKIVLAHFPDINQKVSAASIETFYRLREIKGIEKKPATRELINWIRILLMDPDFDPQYLSKKELPYLGVLFKKSEDYKTAQRYTGNVY